MGFVTAMSQKKISCSSSNTSDVKSRPSRHNASAIRLSLRRLQIENSLRGKVVRRWMFLYRSMVARAHSDTIQRLEPLLEQSFKHEWVADVRLSLRFLPGAEDRELKVPWAGNKYLLRLRLLPWRKQACPAHWNAPVTVTVSKTNPGDTPKTVRYMSLFIRGDALHIVQLQGVPLVEMPKGLRDWAERFVRACRSLHAKKIFVRSSWRGPILCTRITIPQSVGTLLQKRAYGRRRRFARGLRSTTIQRHEPSDSLMRRTGSSGKTQTSVPWENTELNLVAYAMGDDKRLSIGAFACRGPYFGRKPRHNPARGFKSRP
jgi:hypothetical protein